jgi:hypothetical protein
MILLPDSKMGKTTIYLGQAANERLQRTPRIVGNRYVIVGNIETNTQATCKRHGVVSERSLILKMFAFMISVTRLLHTNQLWVRVCGIIGKLLGHSQSQNIARYAHLAADPAIEVADKISERLANSLSPIGPLQKDLKAA